MKIQANDGVGRGPSAVGRDGGPRGELAGCGEIATSPRCARLLAMTPLLVAAALTLFGTACRDGREDGTIHASGHIEATEVRLAAKVGGRLLELPFQEGAAVAAGDVVARFDTVDAAHELARARAELAAADATLRLLLAGTRAEDVRQRARRSSRARRPSSTPPRATSPASRGSPSAAPPPSRRATTPARAATRPAGPCRRRERCSTS